MLGGAVSHVGLFIGAVSGGLIGVFTALVPSRHFRLISPQDVGPGILGGCIGFVAAAAMAAANAHTPIIPIMSLTARTDANHQEPKCGTSRA